MPILIDRRLNPKEKSLGNRQRFIKRVREDLKRAISDQVRTGKIADVDRDHSVSISAKGTSEPNFEAASQSGRRNAVLPGNKEFNPGDRIQKQGQAGGSGAGAGSSQQETEDDFRFVLSRDEVLDLFFEDLELPEMVKLNLKEVLAHKPRRAGFTTMGTPTNVAVARTMRNSFARRIALSRPKQEEVDALVGEIAALEADPDPGAIVRQRIAELREQLDLLERRRKRIAFVDPVDVRFNRFDPQPVPTANAVMFCLMDVSGSMGEREKDLAKRFFVLLHLFLKRRYDRTDIVFIRHTHEAKEVDEQTFFYSTQSGGTVVSTALEEMRRIIAERYPSREWNIYAAQASDGDNLTTDSQQCISLMDNELMRLCQYFAYIEILDERETHIFRSTVNGTSLWQAYHQVSQRWPNFQMTRIAKPADIYPVFRQLFAKQPSGQKK